MWNCLGERDQNGFDRLIANLLRSGARAFWLCSESKMSKRVTHGYGNKIEVTRIESLPSLQKKKRLPSRHNVCNTHSCYISKEN